MILLHTQLKQGLKMGFKSNGLLTSCLERFDTTVSVHQF